MTVLLPVYSRPSHFLRHNSLFGRVSVPMARQHHPRALRGRMITLSLWRTSFKMSRSVALSHLMTPVRASTSVLSTTCDSYTADMADRLTSLTYSDVTGSDFNCNFNPRSVSLDIRSPEELAAVNQFLLTLGRDVASVHEPRPSPNSQAYSHYFDNDQLGQLGLIGMPGIPASSHSQNTYSTPGSQHSSQTPLYASGASLRAGQQLASGVSYNGSMYPHMHDVTNQGFPSALSTERRVSNGTSGLTLAPPTPPPFQVGYQQPSPVAHMHLTPPLDSSSPQSSLSSPSSSSPPHVAHTDANVIYRRNPRGMVPPAALAPVDYTTKAMRTIVPLKSIPTRTPSPVDSEHGSSPLSPMGLSSLALPPPSSHLGRPLYPLLTFGGDDLKLPPLQEHCPRLSPPSSPARDRVTTPVLPSLREVAASAGTATPPSGIEERLSRRLDGLKLNGRSNDDRARHAALVRDLLVTINERYRAQFTSSPSRLSPSPILHDAEMPAVRG